MLPTPDHASPTLASPSPRMHKCVVLTYASGLARFFRVQMCTCVHAYVHMYICPLSVLKSFLAIATFQLACPLLVCCTVSASWSQLIK